MGSLFLSRNIGKGNKRKIIQDLEHEDKKGNFTTSGTTKNVFTIGRVTKKYRRSLCKMSKKMKVIEMNI